MYNSFFAVVIGFFTVSPMASTELPTTESLSTETVEVLTLEYTQVNSDFSVTVNLQIDQSVHAVTSTANSYYEATQQLKRAVAELTEK
ncbi:hypothetical protein [Lewinella sp. W8]|uniref:hypothetical protein n=1 Tax=Lewinella sp. W8 TaxID=2528208 RepID=UPI0010676E82|nr:hypothetical protein [Lewinella sp. W8]MTB50652.1 hypothetical protein [Lewinella sp. W8]